MSATNDNTSNEKSSNDSSDQRLIQRLRREITILNESLREKNRALDAMHWVWCSGGCKGGVHRWTNEPLTEETVKLAERNTLRLRAWYNNRKFRDTYESRGS